MSIQFSVAVRNARLDAIETAIAASATLQDAALAACGHDQVRPDAWTVTNCPEKLPALTDESFGGTVGKLVEVAGIYHKCRAAATGAQK